MSIRVGVSFDGFSAFDVALAGARRAIDAGAASLWMAEHLGYRQSLVSCTAFVLSTERAVVVPTAISPYMWHPMPVAMAMATIAEAAPGRAAIALGTGNPLFLRESGLEIERPLEAMGEFVECLRSLWTGEAVGYNGDRFQLAGARMAFPVPDTIPIYIAAMGEQMLGLAGRVGDGVVLSAGLSAEFAARSLARSEAGARDAGRDPGTLRRAAYIYASVSESSREAMEAVRGRLAFLLRNRFLTANVEQSGIAIDLDALMEAISRRDLERATALVPLEAVEAFAVAGTPSHCRDRLQAYLDAGIDEPVLAIVGDGKEQELALDLVREFSPGAG